MALAAVLGKRSETERKMSQGGKEEFLVSLLYNKRQWVKQTHTKKAGV